MGGGGAPSASRGDDGDAALDRDLAVLERAGFIVNDREDGQVQITEQGLEAMIMLYVLAGQRGRETAAIIAAATELDPDAG